MLLTNDRVVERRDDTNPLDYVAEFKARIKVPPRDRLPRAAIDFIEALPVSLALPGWLFVHAGIRPGIPLAEQTDEDMIWIRSPFLSAQFTGGLRIVHGHTPGRDIVDMPLDHVVHPVG